jgi:hypothetical protein
MPSFVPPSFQPEIARAAQRWNVAGALLDHSRDAALCGSGRRDAAVVDRRDHVSGCERVNGRRRG